jgi:hypothetical protein
MRRKPSLRSQGHRDLREVINNNHDAQNLINSIR